MKEWIDEFKNCFKNPEDNRYQHINFRKIKPVAKDEIGAQLIKNGNLWYLLFKIAKEVCQMEEVLDLFKEALKMNLHNIDLIKQEFDAFYSDFVQNSQHKGPSTNLVALMDLSQEIPNENSMTNHALDESPQKGDIASEKILLEEDTSESPNPGKKKVSRSKKASQQNSQKQTSSKRQRAAFESSYHFNDEQKENIPCSTNSKKRSKNLAHSINNNETLIQLGSYSKTHPLDQVPDMVHCNRH